MQPHCVVGNFEIAIYRRREFPALESPSFSCVPEIIATSQIVK